MNHRSNRSNPFRQGGLTLVIFFSLLRVAAAQVCVDPPSGLVSWWRGEGNANDTIDGNHGTLMNGAAFVAGQVGSAFSFDGADDVVSIPDAPNLNFASTSSFTIELWAFRTSAATVMHLVGKREGCGSPPFYQMAIGSGTFPSEDFPLNVWTHAAVTYDGSTSLAQQYINGVVVASGIASVIGPNTAPFLIGNSGACSPFAGIIDEVSLYNRALSADEIQAILAAGSAGKCAPPAPIGGAVTGMSPTTGKVTCQNLTRPRRKTVRITLPAGVKSWDCSQAGLAVNPGDKIKQTITVTGPAD